jgi:type I restriction enzyme M protein
VDVVLTNPPFGVKGTVSYTHQRPSGNTDDALTVVRPDFWVQTANKQLNFVQHIVAQLKPGGRAAVVVPDNVLFEAGAATSVRRRLLELCRLHTLLRLPAGLFYAQGVRANVLFFERRRRREGPESAERLWIYELRATRRYSLKTKPLNREDLREFVSLYRSWQGRNATIDDSMTETAYSHTHAIVDILLTDECLLDMTGVDMSATRRQPGLARLDELSRLVADDLQHALSLISLSERE